VVRTLTVTSRFSLLGPQYTESIDVFYINIRRYSLLLLDIRDWRRLAGYRVTWYETIEGARA
jgi:hypothetical protein